MGEQGPEDDLQGEPPPLDVPITHATVCTTFDRGEEIWFLLYSRRPKANAKDEYEDVPERWVVFPRSGAMHSLQSAMQVLLPLGPKGPRKGSN